MTIYTVQAPDGKMIKLEGPEGASQEEVIAKAQELYQPKADESMLETAGKAVAGTAAGVGKGIFEAGEAVTSLFGAAPNVVSEALGERAEAVDVAAEQLGIPKGAVKTGEAISIATPIGGVFGGVFSMLGKSQKTMKYLASKSGKIPRAVRKTLDEAAKDPKKIIALESAIAGTSAGVGEATKQATDSRAAGIAAEFLTGAGLGVQAARHAYGLSTAKEDFVESTLAERFRNNPELLVATEQNAATAAKEGLKIRLDLISKDPVITATVDKLTKAGTPETRDAITKIISGFDGQMDATAELLTRDTLTAVDADNITSLAVKNYENQLAKAITGLDSIEDAATRQSVGQDMFESLDVVREAAEKEGRRLFSRVAKGMELPSEAKPIVLKGIQDAMRTAAKDKKFVVGQIGDSVKALEAELKGKMTVDGLNEVRGAIVGHARTLSKSPDGKDAARRLYLMADSISNAIDLAPSDAIKKANTHWREMKKVFDRSELAFFFKENADGLVNAPETMVQKFLTGSRSMKASRELLEFANTPMATNAGLGVDKVRQFARSGFLADMRASVGSAKDITPEAIGRYVSKNKELLDTYGLTDEFKRYGAVAKQVKELKLNQKQLDKLTLAKYAVSENPNTLRNALRSGAYKEQLKRLPPSQQRAFKRTLLDAAIRNQDGSLLPPEKLKPMILSHGRAIAADDEHARRLFKVADLMSRPQGGKEFSEFNKFFNDIDLKESVTSAMLERITRTFLKAVRITRTTKDFYRNKGAQERMVELMMTDEGSKRVLELARQTPASRAFIRALALARTDVTNKAREQ